MSDITIAPLGRRPGRRHGRATERRAETAGALQDELLGPTVARRGLAVILAAGEGTRMKSSRPKVLHEVAGLSLLGHVTAAVQAAGIDAIAVVVGPGREDVAGGGARGSRRRPPLRAGRAAGHRPRRAGRPRGARGRL